MIWVAWPNHPEPYLQACSIDWKLPQQVSLPDVAQNGFALVPREYCLVVKELPSQTNNSTHFGNSYTNKWARRFLHKN